MGKHWRDFLVSMLPPEDQDALRIGHNFIQHMNEQAKFRCSECDHSKHEGKCGVPEEYDPVREEDYCQCMGPS